MFLQDMFTSAVTQIYFPKFSLQNLLQMLGVYVSYVTQTRSVDYPSFA